MLGPETKGRVQCPDSESEVAQSCPALCDPMGCKLPGSSVHETFQARVLEWGAISFSRGHSWPRDGARVSLIGGRCFYHLSHQGSQHTIPYFESRGKSNRSFPAKKNKKKKFVVKALCFPICSHTITNSHQVADVVGLTGSDWCLLHNSTGLWDTQLIFTSEYILFFMEFWY